MDSDEETAPNNQGQIFCLEWVKRSNTEINIDKVELSKKELKEILAGEATQSSLKVKEEPETDEEENEDDKKIKEEDTDNDENWEDVSGESEEEEEDGEESCSDNEENGEEEKVVNIKKEENKEFEGLEEFNFDDYDEEDFHVEKFSDFYMPSDDKVLDDDLSESEDEKENMNLKKDDNLLVCARCKLDSNCLEVNVYNHENNDFYVHHHIDLYNTHPLCLQWLDFDPSFDKSAPQSSQSSDKGSFIAVGTLESVIQIWDLSIVNQMEPDFMLGEDMNNEGTSSTKTSHQDAVLDLAWSCHKRKKILSASADKTVALWDLEKGYIVRRYRKHKEKVQTIEFRKDSADHLLSGAFNGTIYLFDIRTVCRGNDVPKWKINEEVERVCWNTSDDNYFAAGTDQGNIYYFDTRQTNKHLYSWKAHQEAIPSLSMQSDAMLYSASSDGLLKTWKLNEKKATLDKSVNAKLGMVHCFDFNPDVTSMMAVGGQKQGLRLINTENLAQEAQAKNNDEESKPKKKRKRKRKNNKGNLPKSPTKQSPEKKKTKS